MAGTFSSGETKVRPGVYHRYENAGGVSTAGANNAIVAGVIRANWGPLNEVVIFDQSTSVKDTYGSGMTEDLITYMMKAGNSTGYFVRAGSGGSNGSVTLVDDSTDAVSAVTITCKYVGAREFTVSIRDSLTNDSIRQCIIYDGTSTFETVEFEKDAEGGEAAALVEAFDLSENFIAELLDNGSGTLAAVTQQVFDVGENPTVDTDAYDEAMDCLEPYAWNVMCVDTEDVGIHLLVQTFVDSIWETGSYPMACLAECHSSDNPLATRIAHAKTYNDPKIIYVLNGAKDTAGNLIDGYKNAARIGGIIAYVAADSSVTHYVVSGYAELYPKLTNTQIITALQAGCLVLDYNSSGQVWIEQGLNTLITCDSYQDEGWKKIRRVKTRFELMQRIDDTIDDLIGKINNDTDGRAAVIAAGNAVIKKMIAEHKLLDGTEMYEDESNPAEGESAWFIIAVDDIDSLEKIYLNYHFRFAAVDDE